MTSSTWRFGYKPRMSDEGWRVARVAAKAVAGPMGSLGVGLLQDPKGWDPVVPADLHSSKLPPVAADGTAECIQCKTRHLFGELTIANEMFFCRGCTAINTRRQAQADAIGVDVDNVKIGRSWTGTIVGLGVALVALGVCVAIYLS
jgi:hypothetical protein